jgi:ribosome-associated translation inhibitor RaiA
MAALDPASRRGQAGRAGTTRSRRRSTSVDLPVYIRAVDTPLTPEDRDYLRHKLRARLARFGRRVERVSARIEDVNGPRGGVDTRCRIKVVLSGLPSVTIEEQQHIVRAAIDRARARIASAVRRAVERREGRPTAPRASRAAAARSGGE